MEAGAPNDSGEPLGIAGGNEAAVLARGPARDLTRLQQDHLLAAREKRARGPQAREAAADDADLGLDVLRERSPLGSRTRGRRIEGFGENVVHCLVAYRRMLCFATRDFDRVRPFS